MTDTPTAPKPAPMCSYLLPPDARSMLIRASRTPDERERQIAIDQAADEVRRRWPQFFHPNV